MVSEINPQNTVRDIPKKKVLFIVTQSELGGAQRFLCELTAKLDRNKYEVLVAAGSDGDGEFLEVLRKTGVPVKSLCFLKRKIGLYSDFRGYLEIKGLIREFMPNTLFLGSSKAGVLGSLAAKFTSYHLPISIHSKIDSTNHLKNEWQMKNGKWKMQPKVIYRIGGWSFNEPVPWPVRLLYLLAEKYTAKFKDVIMVNNQHDFDQAKKLKIRPRQSVELIHNGIDPYKLEFFGKDEAKIKLFEKIPQKSKSFLQAKITIGTVANFYKTKGLEYLIEAFKILTYTLNPIPYTLVLIGDGPERKNIKNQISKIKMGNKIFLTGRLPDAYKYLPAFDIFVLPSVKEGFPWALLEAMAAKLPVIATNVGAVPEIIENGKNGFLIEPRKPELIAQKIKELADDERLRNELGIQAHQTVVLKFDLNKMIKQTKELL
jgi:glycosyltransferase involved in cell wall biosynthesis